MRIRERGIYIKNVSKTASKNVSKNVSKNTSNTCVKKCVKKCVKNCVKKCVNKMCQQKMYRNEPGSRISSNLRAPDHLGRIPGPDFFFFGDVRFFGRNHVFRSLFDVFQESKKVAKKCTCNFSCQSMPQESQNTLPGQKRPHRKPERGICTLK